MSGSSQSLLAASDPSVAKHVIAHANDRTGSPAYLSSDTRSFAMKTLDRIALSKTIYKVGTIRVDRSSTGTNTLCQVVNTRRF